MRINKTYLKIPCGPDHDKRLFNFHLPYLRKKIGVMVSGGLDSALLYFLIHKLNEEGGRLHKIQPFLMQRQEGSKIYGPKIIQYVHEMFGVDLDIVLVGDHSIDEDRQIWSAINQALQNYDINALFVGSIETMEIHTIGWRPPVKPIDSENFINPFKDLNKSHIVDLVYKLRQEQLFKLSHSCIYQIRCNGCLSCQERAWGFSELGKIDPGEY